VPDLIEPHLTITIGYRPLVCSILLGETARCSIGPPHRSYGRARGDFSPCSPSCSRPVCLVQDAESLPSSGRSTHQGGADAHSTSFPGPIGRGTDDRPSVRR